VSNPAAAPVYGEVDLITRDAATDIPEHLLAAVVVRRFRHSLGNRSGRVEAYGNTAALGALEDRKIPGKAPLAGARGSIGCACAGGETVRNPTALIAVAAASNWDLFTLVNCDIGNPFLPHASIRKETIYSVGGERIGPADL
jgi:hypothetical protein